MDWYLKAAFHDRRFKWAGVTAAGAILALVGLFLLGTPWATKIALFGIFPILVLSVLGMFAVLGLVVRSDYLQRKGG
jgi:uncharacterized membrane protein HdeD (DUF308 family)